MPRGSGGKKHEIRVWYKKDMLSDVRAVRGMGQGLLYHQVVLCKLRLMGAWIKRREVLNGAKRLRSEKLRKPQYREGYAWFLESKRVDGMEKVMSIICGSR